MARRWRVSACINFRCGNWKCCKYEVRNERCHLSCSKDWTSKLEFSSVFFFHFKNQNRSHFFSAVWMLSNGLFWGFRLLSVSHMLSQWHVFTSHMNYDSPFLFLPICHTLVLLCFTLQIAVWWVQNFAQWDIAVGCVILSVCILGVKNDSYTQTDLGHVHFVSYSFFWHVVFNREGEMAIYRP